MITNFSLLLAIFTLAGLALTQSFGVPSLENYAILISCDGLRPDAVEILGAERLPNLYRSMTEGASTKNARTDKMHTVTLPKYTIIVTADHGGRMETKTHLKADSPYNYTIPFVVWGPTVQKGADLYSINPTSCKGPGGENPAHDAEGLPAIEGSSINAKQDLEVTE